MLQVSLSELTIELSSIANENEFALVHFLTIPSYVVHAYATYCDGSDFFLCDMLIGGVVHVLSTSYVLIRPAFYSGVLRNVRSLQILSFQLPPLWLLHVSF